MKQLRAESAAKATHVSLLDDQALRTFIEGLGRHGHPAGCRGSHGACRPLIRAIEQRGAFMWSDLDADEEVARAAWGRLAHVAEGIGVPEETWAELLSVNGWGAPAEEEPHGP